MANIPLTLRDRFSLVGRAIAGQLSLDPSSVGGRLLGGVIQPGGQPPVRGTKEYLSAYAQMPWLRAVASRVSYDVAATEWEVLIERRQGRAVRNRLLQRASVPQRGILVAQMKAAGELEALADHPLIDLLNDFNPAQTGLMARRTTQLHLDLVGEAFWLLERGALDQISAIWPVPPSWILSTPTPRFPFYRVSFRGWQGTIPESEFIHFADVDPVNPYGRGTGTAQALADELETDEYAAKHLKAFFHNRARPDLVVWPKGDQPLKEDEVRRLEEQWNSHSGGFWRAFRPFFLKREVEIKELDQNFRCFSSDTECLTRRGWVTGTALTEHDEIATWHEPSQHVQWQQPTEVHRYAYAGPMHWWHDDQADLLVTPNHRLWFRSGKAWRFATSEEVVAGTYQRAFRGKSRTGVGSYWMRWRVAGQNSAGCASAVCIKPVVRPVSRGVRPERSLHSYKIVPEILAPWLGYFLAEGNLPGSSRSAVNISQTTDVGTLSGLALKIFDAANAIAPAKAWPVTRPNGRTCWTINISNESLRRWLLHEAGANCLERGIPECVFAWSGTARRALLDAMLEGDATKHVPGWTHVTYSTSSRRLADDVQRLCVCLGLRARIHVCQTTHHDSYSIGICNRNEICVGLNDLEIVPYNGDVWCVTVPNGTVFTRRGGKVAVSGNSQQMVQLREYERNTILQVYGVSPETLGILGPGSNRATITMNDSIYSRRVLVPRLELLRSVKQERLAPMFDERIIIHYISPVVKDKELELEAGKIAPWAPTVDEWRERMGLEPLEDEAGKVHIMPTLLAPTRFDESPPNHPGVPDAKDPPHAARATEPERGQTITFQFPGRRLLVDRDAEGRIAGVRDEGGDAQPMGACETMAPRSAHVKQIGDESDEDLPPLSQVAARHEGAWVRALRRVWMDVRASIDEDLLTDAIRAQDFERAALLAGADLAAAGVEYTLVPLMRDVFREGAQAAAAGTLHRGADGILKQRAIAVDLAAINPAAVAYAQDRACALVEGTAALRDRLRQLVVTSQAEGIPPLVLARSIRDRIGLTTLQAERVERFRLGLRGQGVDAAGVARRTSRYAEALRRQRAITIARTETIDALSAGQQELWEEAVRQRVLPARTKRIWLVTLDDSLDEAICEPLTDAVAGLNEPFQPGGFMRPPAHPRCRCSMGLTEIP